MGMYDNPKAKTISLHELQGIYRSLGCKKIYVKKLAPNDNSKNQPYFGSHLTDLPFIPTQEIVASASTSNKNSKRKIKYQASLKLRWLDTNVFLHPAPHAKLIYYPQYPEVRFSGFLKGSTVDASEWMSPDKQGRSEGRWLIFGTFKGADEVIAYLVTPETNLSKELENTKFIQISNVFGQLNVENNKVKESTRDTLIDKLKEIHQAGWIPSQKLTSDMKRVPYKAPNGGGYTLESMLDIAPNGIAEPDYLGWEVKQFGVTRFPRIGAKPTTLMTPEPNGGYYTDKGAIEFVKTYGYADKSGIVDRLNFGGKHIVDHPQKLTSLTLELQGFDTTNSIITDAEGIIALTDSNGNVTASWSFAKLMDHWKRKHSQAVYIPCLRQENKQTKEIHYHYGKDIELGTGTSFELILTAMNKGTVFYDPGIKLEQASSPKPKIKKRSQFRTNHKHIDTLYKKFEFVDVENP